MCKVPTSSGFLCRQCRDGRQLQAPVYMHGSKAVLAIPSFYTTPSSLDMLLNPRVVFVHETTEAEKKAEQRAKEETEIRKNVELRLNETFLRARRLDLDPTEYILKFENNTLNYI